MRHIQIALDDKDYNALEKAKGKRTWYDLIMTLAIKEIKRKKK